jgi:O-antigen/teichoic acid export membrane protein
MGLASQSVGTFITFGVKFFLRFFIGILTARFLGPEGRGLWFLLFTSLNMSALIGDLGLGAAAIYHIGKDKKCLPEIMGNLLLLLGGATLVIGLVGGVFLRFGPAQVIAAFPFWMWVGIVLLIPVVLLEKSLAEVLFAQLHVKQANLTELMQATAFLCLIIVLVAIMDQGIAGAFIAYAASLCLSTGTLFILVLRYGGYPSRPNLALFGNCLRFGVKVYLANLTRLANLRLNAFLLAALTAEGTRAAGIYSVASSIAELLLFFPLSIRRSLFPMVATSNTETADRLTSTACRHTLFLTVLAALGFALIGPFAIPHLYGPEFREAIAPLMVLLPGIVLLAQARIFYGDLAGRGKPGVNSICVAVALVAMAVLNLLLIPPYGVMGAAMASTGAYTIEFLVAGTFFVSHTGLPWRDLFVLRKTDLRYYRGVLQRIYPRLAKI